MEHKKFSLNKEDGWKIAQVIGWTMASAFITLLIDLLAQVDFSTYVWAVPMVNTVLYAMKRFVSGKMDLEQLDTPLK